MQNHCFQTTQTEPEHKNSPGNPHFFHIIFMWSSWSGVLFSSRMGYSIQLKMEISGCVKSNWTGSCPHRNMNAHSNVPSYAVLCISNKTWQKKKKDILRTQSQTSHLVSLPLDNDIRLAKYGKFKDVQLFTVLLNQNGAGRCLKQQC